MKELKTLYIHCGLHKTGSTALQRQLSFLADDLENTGTLIPRTMSINRGAHHGVAYVQNRPRAYRLNKSNLDDLAKEIRSFDGPDCCLSSEDFETVLTNSDGMERLMKLCQSANAKPVFVIYLRHQASYLESLYLQLLRIGFHQSVREAGLEAIKQGTISWRKWVFQFDYVRAVGLARERGVEIIVRNYHELHNGSSIEDFLLVIGRSELSSKLVADRRLNPARTNGNLQRFAANRIGQAEIAQDYAAQFDQMIDGQRPILSDEMCAEISDHFRAGNQWLFEVYGIDLNASCPGNAVPRNGPILDLVFSDATLGVLEEFKSGQLHDAERKRLLNTWYSAL